MELILWTTFVLVVCKIIDFFSKRSNDKKDKAFYELQKEDRKRGFIK
jgi:hypothetical protein